MRTKPGFTSGHSAGCLPISLLPCAAPGGNTSGMISSANLPTLYLVALLCSERSEPIGNRAVAKTVSAVILTVNWGRTYEYTTSRIPPPGPRPIITISTRGERHVGSGRTEHLGSKAPVEGTKAFFGAHLEQAGPCPLCIEVWLAGMTDARQWKLMWWKGG